VLIGVREKTGLLVSGPGLWVERFGSIFGTVLYCCFCPMTFVLVFPVCGVLVVLRPLWTAGRFLQVGWGLVRATSVADRRVLSEAVLLRAALCWRKGDIVADPSGITDADKAFMMAYAEKMQSGKPSVLGMHERVHTDSLCTLEIFTTAGMILAQAHGPLDAPGTMIMACGAIGGFSGPAMGLYYDWGEDLATLGHSALQIHYRVPNDLVQCVGDVMFVARALRERGARRFAFCGHSFGGAVALQAAASLPASFVAGTVCLATQTAGAMQAAPLLAKTEIPVLLVHGEGDGVLPPTCSRQVAKVLGKNAELQLLPGVGHLMIEKREEIRSLVAGRVSAWLAE